MSQSDFVSRGQALVAAGQFQEAVKVCRLGLLGRPTTVEGRVVLGQALLALKRFDEVLAEMRVALELDHSSTPAQVLRAEALLRKGDTHAAIEALHKARQGAPGDPRIMQLLGEAEHGGSRSSSVSHPAVGFIGSGDTKHYPGRSAGAPPSMGDEDSGPGNYTQPTSLQAPGAAKRSSQRSQAVADPDGRTEMTPPPVILAVGDKSGTVEVDPESEGIELPGDPDFDDVAAPPVVQRGAAIGGERGSVKSSRGKPATLAGKKSAQHAAQPPGRGQAKWPQKPVLTSSQPLDEDDLEEIEDTPQPQILPKRPGKVTQARNAVDMPSGVIGEFGPGDRSKPSTLPPPFGGPAGGSPFGAVPPGAPMPFSVPPPGAAMPLGGPPRPNSLTGPPAPSRGNPPSSPPPPRGVPGMAPPPAPLPPAPSLPGMPRGPIAAALPTVAAAQPPPAFVQQQAPYPPTPASYAAAAMRTVAIPAQPDPAMSPAQQQSALAVEHLFGNDGQQNWQQGEQRSMAAANEPTARPGELDPHILALMSGGAMQSAEMPPPAAPLVAMEQIGFSAPPAGAGMRTGVRKTRSRVQIAVWMMVGVIVIGGGVFAGFKIRAMRLEKQIAAARTRATDLAKADTWSGWTAARDSLSGIVQASGTLANRAALARTRALIAFEFGDGLPEAKDAVEALAGQGGLDTKIADTLAALARGDVKAARTAAEAAVAGSDADAAAQYVAAHAALLAGDAKVGVAAMKLAADKEPRPLHGVGLAMAHAAAYNWDDAVTAIDRVRSTSPDHPGATIARGMILAASGRIFPGSALGSEVKGQLEQVIAESRQSIGQQPRGVSPTQAAFASLVLAQVEFARGDLTAARRAVRGATDFNLDDVRFAEETVKTLYTLGELALARIAGDLAMRQFPTSARTRITYAQVMLALGRANEAIDVLSKQADTMAIPDALAVRGTAYIAIGDLVTAGADFDAALKKLPSHEPSLVGRSWLDLAAGDVEGATKRMGDRMSAKGASLAVQTAYAAALRRAADAPSKDKAKDILEKVVAGPAGPEQVRAQLELARIYRDAGDYAIARTAFDKAARNGGLEARFEGALFSIEYSKPEVGHAALEALLKEAGDRPSPQLIIELARARMLIGDHVLAAELLAKADTMASVERFKLDRERGRLALRKSDFAGAALALGRALETCGSDAETFLLAADAATADRSGLADKVKKLAAERLKGRPEAHIVSGKLLIASEKSTEASEAYQLAIKALDTDRASNRRRAQAHFGLAVIDYAGQNLVAAQKTLDLVMAEDPTIVDAYIFAAEIATEKDKKKAYAYARKAVQFNPDYAYAWLVVGRLAHELRDKRQLVDAIGRLTVIAPAGDELKELQKL